MFLNGDLLWRTDTTPFSVVHIHISPVWSQNTDSTPVPRNA